jgi:hypothetical protein
MVLDPPYRDVGQYKFQLCFVPGVMYVFVGKLTNYKPIFYGRYSILLEYKCFKLLAVVRITV